MQNLAHNVKISFGLAAVGASSSIDSNTAILDMSGWDGVVFITPITDSVQNGVATLTVQASTTNADTYMAAITSASATATSATNDDLNSKLLVVDVYRPQKRYVQGTLTSSAANIAYGETIAIQYAGIKAPITEAASIADQTVVVGS